MVKEIRNKREAKINLQFLVIGVFCDIISRLLVGCQTFPRMVVIDQVLYYSIILILVSIVYVIVLHASSVYSDLN